MKALTIMSVLALTISGITVLAGATAGSAERFHAASSAISVFAGKDVGVSFAWKAN